MAEFPTAFATVLPKAELHVHLEGTVDPVTLLELAERHGVRPPAPDVAGVDEWYDFGGFDEFLERYFFVVALLQDPDDFAVVAERYLTTAHEQGAVHVELHVSATGHLIEIGHRWAEVQEGIVAGCAAAEAGTGISWALIPDVSPHLDAERCRVAIDEVRRDRDDHVVAIGMGGPADHWATRDFAPIFADARADGLHAVAHAGEHGPAAEVAFAIDMFGAERIQHGIGAMSDPDVVRLLVDRNVACDVCPGSNLALAAVPSPAAHPLPAMIDAGVTVTLGSDDPPMFHTSLLDEYRRAWDWCQLDASGLVALADNSLRASFAPPERLTEWRRTLAARSRQAEAPGQSGAGSGD